MNRVRCLLNTHRRNLYDVLGVSRLSKPEEIRAAYFELAKKLHPDTVSSTSPVSVDEDSSRQFREVQEAYSTLSNSWKRTLYDQDLQFQSAVAMTGSTSSTSSSVSHWRDNYNLETPEARIARRERYKRYAAGERNDLPPVPLTTRGALGGLVLCGAALTWICAKAPQWFGGQGDPTYHDPVTDDKSVPLVRAFFNPITRKWERLGDGEMAPSFQELVGQYRRLVPKIIDRWMYEEKEAGNDPSTIETLTVTNVPKTHTSPAAVYIQETDKSLGVNRKSLNETIARFLEIRS